jgi:amino acid transporter
MLGFVVPADSPDLASAGHGAKYSPFVLAANLAGVQGLGHLFNAMILAALLSMANAAIFASSRALQALCNKGMGPAIFAGVNKKRGTPLNALYLAFAMGLLALVTLAPGGGALFDWLLSLAGVTNYFTWASICASHLRMRAAMRRQGRDPRTELIWRSPFGVWGSWLAIAVCGAGIAAQVVTAAWPLGGRHDWQAGLRDCLGIVFVLAMFGGYMAVGACRRKSEPVLVPLEEVDLDTGRRTRESASAADELAAAEKRAARERLGYREDWPVLKKTGFYVRREFRWLRVFRKRKAATEVQTGIPMK